jgi:predicted ATP-dependent serine protease
LGVVQSIAEGSTKPLPFRLIKDLDEGESKGVPWIWEGFVADGTITLLAGLPKVGKSTLLFGLLSALAHGEPFLDRATRQTTALILTEEARATLAPKAERWGLGNQECLLWQAAVWTPWPSVVRQALERCAVNGHRLLVVDPLAQWARVVGDSENSAGAMLEALQPLIEARAAGVAVLVVAHQRKSQGEHGTAVRGSTALTGAADVVIELERAGASESERQLLSMSRFEVTPSKLTISLEADGYSATSESVGQRTRILRELHGRGPQRSDILAGRLDISEATVRRRLQELEDAGDVTSTGSGKRNDAKVWRAK